MLFGDTSAVDFSSRFRYLYIGVFVYLLVRLSLEFLVLRNRMHCGQICTILLLITCNNLFLLWPIEILGVLNRHCAEHGTSVGDSLIYYQWLLFGNSFALRVDAGFPTGCGYIWCTVHIVRHIRAYINVLQRTRSTVYNFLAVHSVELVFYIS